MRARPLTAVFVAALCLRLLVLAVLPLHAPMVEGLEGAEGAEGARTSAWAWGAESASLAMSLVEGRGYADPWGLGTGASSWLTPPYPALVAIVVRLCGGLQASAAVTLFVLQSLASALTCVLLARLGRALERPRAGLAAAWAFALYPISIWHATHTVWDTTFVALLVTWVVLLLARLRREALPRHVIPVGLAYGLLLFVNPAPITLLPAILVYLALGAGRLGPAVRNAWVFCLAAFFVVTPWMARNARVLGTPALRPNFGLELMIGNHDEAIGHPLPFRHHPSHVEAELARYNELGEVRYSAECTRRGLAWIRANPGDFGRLTLLRGLLFWVGDWPTLDPRTSAGRGAARDPASWLKFATFSLSGVLGLLALVRARLATGERVLFGGGLLLFQVPYLLTHVSERYRFPVDPMLVFLTMILLLPLAGSRDDATA